MLGFLSFLKSGKAILGIVFVVALIGAGWYISNIREENRQLDRQIAVLASDKQTLQNDIERSRQKFQSQIDALESSLDAYMSSLSMVEETNKMLKQDIDKVTANDEELKACLGRELPDSVIQRLLN